MIVRCLACPRDGFCRRCEEFSSPAAVVAFQQRLALALPDPEPAEVAEHDCPCCGRRTLAPVECDACIEAGYRALALF
jgi:hypothetical protein